MEGKGEGEEREREREEGGGEGGGEFLFVPSTNAGCLLKAVASSHCNNKCVESFDLHISIQTMIKMLVYL